MKKKIVIFGGGMTGLVAGRELVHDGHEVHVYEASDHLGGLASTFRDNEGFVYDNGPRFIFSTLAEKIGIAEICKPVKYFEHLYVNGKYYLFPFGFIKNPKYCLSVGLAFLTRSLFPKPKNLGQFLRTYYGRTFSREVLSPLIEKWSGVPSDEMSIDFASRLLPTNVGYIIDQLIKKMRGGITEDYYRKGRYIVYPEGSNSKIFEALAKTEGLQIHFNSPLQRLATENGNVVSARINGQDVRADYFISAIPISKMVHMVDRPNEMGEWEKFKYRGIMILFLKLNRAKVLDGLWTWFPEAKYKFYRISEYKNALAGLAPAGKTLVSIEIPAQEEDAYWQLNAEEVYESIEKDLRDLYSLTRDQIIGFDLRKSPCAYPVLRKSTEEAQRKLVHQTPLKNLYIAGRTGMFQYRMLEGCYESAITCVEFMRQVMVGRETKVAERIAADKFGRPLLVPE